MNKVVENALKNVLQLSVIIFILVVALQTNAKESKTQIAEEKQKTQIIEKSEEIAKIETTRETESVTSRSSTIRNRKNEKQEEKEPIEEVIVEPEIKYTRIEEITISKDMDLTVRTGLSKEDFKKLIANVKQDTSKFFYENSDMIYDLCAEYQINEIFFCGLISAESGWNIASNHRRTYNYISLMYKGKLIQYSSLEEGLRVAAQKLHDNYLTEGGRFYHGKTLSGVKTKFCPASSTWVNLVYGRMQQIVNSKTGI